MYTCVCMQARTAFRRVGLRRLYDSRQLGDNPFPELRKVHEDKQVATKVPHISAKELHISAKEPYTSATEPYKRGSKEPSTKVDQKSPRSPIKSPVRSQKIPVPLKKNPISPPKSNIFPQSARGQTVSNSEKSARYSVKMEGICKRALISTKEPSFPQKRKVSSILHLRWGCVFLERTRILSGIQFTTHFMEFFAVETKRFIGRSINVIFTRQTCCQRSSRAAESKRRALDIYFSSEFAVCSNCHNVEETEI